MLVVSHFEQTKISTQLLLAALCFVVFSMF